MFEKSYPSLLCLRPGFVEIFVAEAKTKTRVGRG
jgi:hypothetical protein